MNVAASSRSGRPNKKWGAGEEVAGGQAGGGKDGVSVRGGPEGSEGVGNTVKREGGGRGGAKQKKQRNGEAQG